MSCSPSHTWVEVKNIPSCELDIQSHQWCKDTSTRLLHHTEDDPLYPLSHSRPKLSVIVMVLGASDPCVPVKIHCHADTAILFANKRGTHQVHAYVCKLTSLRDATARWRGVSHILSLALTRAPEERKQPSR